MICRTLGLRITALVVVFSAAAVLQPSPSRAQYDPRAPEPIGKIRGSLVIHGGGAMPDAVRDRFVELAGGRAARIAVIPTADARADDEDGERWLEPWRKCEVKSVALLHTRSRERANEHEFIEPLTEATAVWFSGGDQSRLEAAYVGTAVERAVNAVLERGGVVGGTSAGAAFLSRVMIDRGEVHRGLDLLPGSVIDQHFIARNRQERLTRVLAEHPGLVGFGVDEGTAMIVRGRSIEVLGESAVVVCLAKSATRPERIERLTPGKPADLIALSRAAVARSGPQFPPAEVPPPDVPSGSLIIVGGGGMPAGLLERFIELAGGPDAPIVYVPCEPVDVIPREPGFVAAIRRAGAKHVSWIHTKDRVRANSDDEFLAPLRDARGIWFGGGRQWNLVDSYHNTTAHQLMHDVLARGGVIGGSSAGASIQGDYMPRGDPLGNLNIIAEGYERGLGFLTGVAIDQHFTQRNRFADMKSLVQTFPQLLGIGIDEGTAIVVRGHVAEVVGANKVHFYDARRLMEDSESDHIIAKAGEQFDLLERRHTDSAIFNGRDLTGWIVEGTADFTKEDGGATKPVWSVADGVIDCAGKGFGFLRYDTPLRDFVLRVEFRMTKGGNSGIGIRGVKFTGPFETRPSAASYEIQLLDDGDKPPTAHSSGSLYRFVAPTASAVRPAGEWNTIEIECVGPRVRVTINNRLVQDVNQNTIDAIAKKPLAGYVSLQNHGGHVEFRNVRLRDLLPSVKPGINDPFADPNVGEFVERFEKEGREVYDQREKIVESCQLKPGMVVADIGAGTGLFTRLFSPAVGAEGKVFAVDISAKFVEHITKTCDDQGLKNVVGVVCTPTSVELPDNSIDLAFVCDTYHHFEFPDRTLKSIRRALRPGGQLVVVEFSRIPGVSSEWIMNHVRADQQTFTNEIAAAGFKRIDDVKFLKESYFVRFAKRE